MRYTFDTFRGDLFGGLTSMVVALPVALGMPVIVALMCRRSHWRAVLIPAHHLLCAFSIQYTV